MTDAVAFLKRNSTLVWDAAAAAGSVWLSYALRLRSAPVFQAYAGQALVVSALATVAMVAGLALAGAYRVYWRKMPPKDSTVLGVGLAAGFLLLLVLLFLMLTNGLIIAFPRSVFVINIPITCALLVGGRSALKRRSR